MMKYKQIYIDTKGNVFEPSSGRVKVSERKQTYVILRKNNELLCIYDEDNNVFTLPKLEDVQNLNLKPTSVFNTIAYIKEKNRYYKEFQTFNVYELSEGKIDDIILQWCSVNGILLHELSFDETLFNGFKNLYVRD